VTDVDDGFVPTDLHGHTLFSDGRTTPEEYVAFRAQRRFEVIALSDHDTFAGVPRAAAEAQRRGVTLVPAMEATSFVHFGTDRAEQVHVLAYFPPAFLDDGRLWKTALHARSLQIADAWRAYVLGFVARQEQRVRDALDETALAAMTSSEFPQLQSFILRIAERCPDAFPHFQLDHVHFWDHELFAWSPEALIDQIRVDGGLDVVAHPNRYRDKDRLARVVDYASGLEVYTSRHNHDVASRFRALAESKGKHWTASSDDHQHRAYMHPPAGTPRRTVERILAGH
jgi:hypothetical protein